MKHTPGDWRVSKAGTFITAHDMSAICRMNYGGKWEWATKKGSFEDLANAYRIVDCVNGCASIKNPLAVGKLLGACRFALKTLNNITTEEFATGKDKSIRARLEYAISEATED